MPASEFQCEVTSFKQLTPTVFETCFTTDKPVEFQGGQFISIVIPGAGPKGRDLRRAYSIASAPETRPVELCVKLVEGGPGTNYLYKLRAGDRFRGFAPYGHFVFEPKPGRDAIFISTGTGIAPFRSMILSDAYRAAPARKAVCLLGVREEEEVLYDQDLRALPGLEWVPCVSRPTGAWKGFKGRVTDWLRQAQHVAWTETDYYLCGGGAMIDEVKALLTEKGVTKDSIYQEVYYKTPKGDGVASEVTGT
jgi:CDP-4-dehydro-6-deoxyglucose reductase